MEKDTVLTKLAKVQQELKAPKTQFNKFGNYNYRNQEDILEAVKPLLAKHGLVLMIEDEIHFVGNRFYVQATAHINCLENGSHTSATAYAREVDNKSGMDASQITGAASSYARKYALNGLFLIDDTKDSDFTNGITATVDLTTKENSQPVKINNQTITTANNIPSPAFKCSGCGGAMTVAEKVYSKSKFNKEICRNCQSKENK